MMTTRRDVKGLRMTQEREEEGAPRPRVFIFVLPSPRARVLLRCPGVVLLGVRQ